MKSLKLLFCISFFILNFSVSFGQNWLWGDQSYGSLKSNDYGLPVATDKNGNAYITGNYETTIIFGTDTLKGSNSNAYLAKYNSSGSFLWATQPIATSKTSYSYGSSVSIDEMGNVLITGSFTGNIQFGSYLLSTQGTSYYDLYLVKYDTGGNVLWASQSILSSKNSTIGSYSLATDKSGNSLVTGYFEDTVYLGADTLITPYKYGENAFIVKYDSMGNVLWAEQSVTPSRYSSGMGNSVATDNEGNSYITGYFYDSLYLGSNLLINPYIDYYSVFLVKYSPSGNVLWAKQSTNGSIDSYGYSNSVVTDQAGNAYITGYFQNILKFDGHTVYSPSSYSVFFTKYDAGGNALWAKQSSPGWLVHPSLPMRSMISILQEQYMMRIQTPSGLAALHFLHLRGYPMVPF